MFCQQIFCRFQPSENCILLDKLKSGSHLPKKIVLFASLKALKNDENAFYFVLVFVTTFWSFYDCLYFSRCWTIFVLQLFDNKAVTS